MPVNINDFTSGLRSATLLKKNIFFTEHLWATSSEDFLDQQTIVNQRIIGLKYYKNNH